MRNVFMSAWLLLPGLLLPGVASAQDRQESCSVQERAEGACDQPPASPTRRAASRATYGPSRAIDGDAVWQGAAVGGAIGLGYGVIGAMLSDCPPRDGRCAADRAALVALSAALGAGIGVAVDAMTRPELTGAPLPGPPASERRIGLPAPSSRGAGVRFKLAW